MGSYNPTNSQDISFRSQHSHVLGLLLVICHTWHVVQINTHIMHVWWGILQVGQCQLTHVCITFYFQVMIHFNISTLINWSYKSTTCNHNMLVVALVESINSDQWDMTHPASIMNMKVDKLKFNCSNLYDDQCTKLNWYRNEKIKHRMYIKWSSNFTYCQITYMCKLFDGKQDYQIMSMVITTMKNKIHRMLHFEVPDWFPFTKRCCLHRYVGLISTTHPGNPFVHT